MSKKTTYSEMEYPSYVLEILAVIEPLKNLKVYLLRMHFEWITDCNAFKKTLEKKIGVLV